MARIEGTRRMMRAGKALVWIGLSSLLLWVVMTPIGAIYLDANGWAAIGAVHELLLWIGVLALGWGFVIWIAGWVTEGFVE